MYIVRIIATQHLKKRIRIATLSGYPFFISSGLGYRNSEGQVTVVLLQIPGLK